MAASRCMCFSGRTLTSWALSISQLSNKKSCQRILQVSPVLANRTFCRGFSSKNANEMSDSGGVKNLTQQILRTKIDEEAAKSSTEQQSKQSGGQSEKKSAFYSKRAMKFTLYGLGVMFSGMAGYLVAVFGAPPKDDEGDSIKDEFSGMPTWKAYLLRTWKEVLLYNKLIKEPSRPKLLPDPLTEPYYQPPYTLVLEMTGVLVHPDWTYKTGWRFKKRPGVDYFLQQIGPPLFEVVIYTSEQGFTAFPIIDSLDPNGYIMYRLFRDATRYLNGHHVKDLACLNRDLSKVIIVDWNDRSIQLQPENAVRIKKWVGNDDDRSLVDLAMFLRTIATNNVDDVRTVLEFYRQYDDPLEAFRVNQRRLQEEQEKASKVKLEVERGAGNLASSWAQGLLRRRH